MPCLTACFAEIILAFAPLFVPVRGGTRKPC